jgi:hypothetical protein
MAFEIDEKQVLPQAGAGRARFQPVHADPVSGQRLEQRVHGARPVLRRHHQRRFIVARTGDRMPTQHPEARRVVRIVLDMRRQHVQRIDRGCGLAGDGGGARLASRQPRRFGVACHRNPRQSGQMAREPQRALRKRLGVRIDLAHRV